jgi:Plasmid pRiA4b ORF-3-like protein
MPKQPDSPEAAMRMLLDQAGLSFEERLRQWLDAQTFFGGRRVAKQPLPPLPEHEAATVHQVKVSLHGAKPRVWRRLEIPSAMTLDRVHAVLQTAFGWYNAHLHSFETVYGEFGSPEGEDWTDHGDESAVALAQVATIEKAKVIYVYDFGDDWRHDIVVEKIRPAEPGVRYPRCTGGKGDPPEEDGGGIWVFNSERAADGTGHSGIDVSALTAALTADRPRATRS